MNRKKIIALLTIFVICLISGIIILVSLFGKGDKNESINENGLVTLYPTDAYIKIYKSNDTISNGRGVIVIPGGGYRNVGGGYEGADWVPLLNNLGYTAAVIKYTTPPKTPDGPLNEVKEAMKYLRDNKNECNVGTGIIGVMGFSAGGHLASTAATHMDGNERPGFQVLFYPVITMDANYTHEGSRTNLIGANPSPELIDLYSNEKQVTADTPPAYICWADDDSIVPPYNSIVYAEALAREGVPVHTKNFNEGEHGFGFLSKFKYHNEMIDDLTQWFKDIDKDLNENKES